MTTEAIVFASHGVGAAKAPEISEALVKTLSIITILICSLGLIGNVIVLWLLCCKIKKNRFTLYFQNMIAANILVIIFSYYTHFISLINFSETVSVSTGFASAMNMLHVLGQSTSFYIFIAICLRRCFLVFIPVWYLHHRPKHCRVIVCIILWGLSCLMSLMDYFGCFPRRSPMFYYMSRICKVATILKIILELMIFVPAMVISAFALFIRMLKKAQQTPPAGLDITILLTTLMFLVLDTSARIIHIVMLWVEASNMFLAFKLGTYLESILSSAPPFLYLCVGCHKRQIGEPFHMILERAFMSEGNIVKRTQLDQEQA